MNDNLFVEPNCIRAICDIEIQPGVNQTTRLLSVRTGLVTGYLFDETKYRTPDNLPNDNGVRAMTAAFIQGLISNIRVAHSEGFWNEADHMRHIMDELNNAFVDTVDFKISKL